MPKTIDKQTLNALLAAHTKDEIAEQFGITAKSVTRLIRQYGLANPPYVQSMETKQRRAAAVKTAHQRDPELTARKVRGLKAHSEKIKGKHWEDVYSAAQVARMKETQRSAHLGKKVARSPRSEPKLCSLCGAPVEPGEGKKMQSYCKACMSAYFKDYYRTRKEHYLFLNSKARRRRQAEWRRYLVTLKSQPCRDCGQCYPSYCMDFDHLERASKVAAVPVLITGNAARERILEEIGKTEVVCANCHRQREHARYLAAGKKQVHLSPRQRHNKELLAQAKSQPCLDCGQSFAIWQMDFDHVAVGKVERVGYLAMSGSTEALLAEIAKCEVICAVCHRIRTFSHK